MDDTDKLIPISIIESILTDEETFLEFINQEGIYADINVLEYTTAINNYMSYILNNTSDIEENVFIHANNINTKFKTGIRYDYLLYMLNTLRIINIGTIESILNDEEMFKRFMKFHENADYFEFALINYLSAIWEYVAYMNKNNLALSVNALRRYNEIVKEFSLDFKRVCVLSGEHIEEDMDENFANEILKNVDFNRSKFNIALDIYKELCKKCTYDPAFFALEQDLNNPISAAIYNKSVSEITKNKNKVVCRTWAIMYQNLLNRVGIKAKVAGKFHKYVLFDCDGTMFKADGTNVKLGRKDHFYLNDLTRCQLGMPVAGFECLEKDKNIQKYLDENEENLHYNNSLENIANQYKEQYIKKQNISFSHAFRLLNNLIVFSKLVDLELVKYVDVLYRVMLQPFTDIQKGSNYIVIPDENNTYKVSYLITYTDADGILKYNLLNGNNGFEEISKDKLINLINKNEIIISGKKKEILGIKEEINNGYSK